MYYFFSRSIERVGYSENDIERIFNWVLLYQIIKPNSWWWSRSNRKNVCWRKMWYPISKIPNWRSKIIFHEKYFSNITLFLMRYLRYYFSQKIRTLATQNWPIVRSFDLINIRNYKWDQRFFNTIIIMKLF